MYSLYGEMIREQELTLPEENLSYTIHQLPPLASRSLLVLTFKAKVEEECLLIFVIPSPGNIICCIHTRYHAESGLINSHTLLYLT